MGEERLKKGMEIKGEEKELEAIERDSRWLYDNYDEFKRMYEGKLIAVKDKNILSVADDTEGLINNIEKAGEDPAWVYVTSFPPKDIVFIL